MTDATRIADIKKNGREVLRVELSEFKEFKLLNCRIWAGAEDEAVPTKSGWAIRVDLIGKLREALADAEVEARRLGWLT